MKKKKFQTIVLISSLNELFNWITAQHQENTFASHKHKKGRGKEAKNRSLSTMLLLSWRKLRVSPKNVQKIKKESILNAI